MIHPTTDELHVPLLAGGEGRDDEEVLDDARALAVAGLGFVVLGLAIGFWVFIVEPVLEACR